MATRVTKHHHLGWLQLKAFLDWLLDPKQWPETDYKTRSVASADWKKVGEIRRSVERLSHTMPTVSFSQAATLLREEEGLRQQAKEWHYYKAPGFGIVDDPKDGNLQLKRRIFVAKLILEKFRDSPVYKNHVCRSKDTFKNMRRYCQDNGYGANIYEMAKQTYYRFLRHDRFTPATFVIGFLYHAFRRHNAPPLPPMPRKLGSRDAKTVLGLFTRTFSREERKTIDSLAAIAARDRERVERGRVKRKRRSSLGAKP